MRGTLGGVVNRERITGGLSFETCGLWSGGVINKNKEVRKKPISK